MNSTGTKHETSIVFFSIYYMTIRIDLSFAFSSNPHPTDQEQIHTHIQREKERKRERERYARTHQPSNCFDEMEFDFPFYFIPGLGSRTPDFSVL